MLPIAVVAESCHAINASNIAIASSDMRVELLFRDNIITSLLALVSPPLLSADKPETQTSH